MDQDTAVTAVTEVTSERGPSRDTVLLGKYRVESTLGFGGMGVVIRAHNVDLDERVAIKLLRDDVQVDDENVTRFVREAKNAVKLKSEHVARIRDVGTFEDGRPFMVMDLLEGLDLGKMLLHQGKLERARAVDLLLQACDAIGEAHSLGIVHRDIKPTNLFVTKRRDGSDLLKVLDFGISKAQVGPDMSLTQTQSMLGTPAYMSPEQMRSARTVDRRSDIWSLGCVLYELVEGRAPFEAENFAELCVMVSVDPFAPMTAAPELTPVMERALAKQIDARFQDVAELAYALEPFASEPERAHRQVARVFRMLGRAHPERRDSTPAALTRDTQTSNSSGALRTTQVGGTHPVTIPELRSAGPWKAIAILLVLFGVGFATVRYGLFPDGDSLPAAQTDDPAAADDDGQPGAGNAVTTARVDAGTALNADAAVAKSASTAAGTAKRAGASTVPPKPKPPRRAVKSMTKPKHDGSAAPPPPPAPPPTTTAPAKPRCDPFANPKGCN